MDNYEKLLKKFKNIDEKWKCLSHEKNKLLEKMNTEKELYFSCLLDNSIDGVTHKRNLKVLEVEIEELDLEILQLTQLKGSLKKRKDLIELTQDIYLECTQEIGSLNENANNIMLEIINKYEEVKELCYLLEENKNKRLDIIEKNNTIQRLFFNKRGKIIINKRLKIPEIKTKLFY